MLTGENGILTRANDAKEETEVAEEKEAISLAYSGVMADTNGTGVTAEKHDSFINVKKNGKMILEFSGFPSISFATCETYL